MAGTQEPSAGTDFWAALGIGQEPTGDGSGTATAPAPESAAPASEPCASAAEWLSMFSTPHRAAGAHAEVTGIDVDEAGGDVDKAGADVDEADVVGAETGATGTETGATGTDSGMIETGVAGTETGGEPPSRTSDAVGAATGVAVAKPASRKNGKSRKSGNSGPAAPLATASVSAPARRPSVPSSAGDTPATVVSAAPETPGELSAGGARPKATRPSAPGPRTETKPSSRKERPRQAQAGSAGTPAQAAAQATATATATAGHATGPGWATGPAWVVEPPTHDPGAPAVAERSGRTRGVRPPADPAAPVPPAAGAPAPVPHTPVATAPVAPVPVPPAPVPPAPGAPVSTSGLTDAIGGWHLIGTLWQDPGILEIHIRGAEVTVCRPLGMGRVAGFPSDGAARAAIEALTAAQDEVGAVVRRIGGSVVVSRRRRESPGTAGLVAAGVITEEQVSEVERALADMRAVTVTGPAAPVIVRALAALIPPGSRVFEGPFGVLPAGCVAAASPLDADYVVGVRPGTTAEEMAAAGQIGALVANPRTPFPAAVRLAVSGRSAAPGTVTAAN